MYSSFDEDDIPFDRVSVSNVDGNLMAVIFAEVNAPSTP